MMFEMTSRAKRTVAGLLVVGILGTSAAGAVAATGGGGNNTPSPTPPPTAQQKRSVKASTVPASVKRAETAAEDVTGYLEKGMPAKSRAEAQLLRQLAHGRAAADMRTGGVPSSTIKAFQQRADRVAKLSAGNAPQLRVSLAANHVSQLMPAVYGRYTDPVPPAVLRLDYLDREIQLRSQAGQLDRQRAATAALAHTWKQVRPQLIAAGGSKVAIAYDSHVKALRAGGQPASIQQQALKGLDIVDQMENVFLGK